LGPIGLSPV